MSPNATQLLYLIASGGGNMRASSIYTRLVYVFSGAHPARCYLHIQTGRYGYTTKHLVTAGTDGLVRALHTTAIIPNLTLPFNKAFITPLIPTSPATLKLLEVNAPEDLKQYNLELMIRLQIWNHFKTNDSISRQILSQSDNAYKIIYREKPTLDKIVVKPTHLASQQAISRIKTETTDWKQHYPQHAVGLKSTMLELEQAYLQTELNTAFPNFPTIDLSKPLSDEATKLLAQNEQISQLLASIRLEDLF